MNEKILTLVVPTYNMEKYLDRCLSSLLVQEEDMGMFEVIVVNDGSKDRSAAIAQIYQIKFPNTFSVINKENGHYGSCINRALIAAKGTFIKVLDADDAFDNQTFRRFLHFLSGKEVHDNADLILSDYCIVDNNGIIQTNHYYSDYLNPFSLDQITWQDREDWFIHCLTYRTSILQEIGYIQTEGISYTDEEWIVKPLVAVNNCYRFKAILYHYTVGREGQSMSSTVFTKGLSMRIAVAKSILCFFNSLTNQTNAAAVFTKGRLLSLLNYIYHTTLFSPQTDRQAIDQLKSFDELLKEMSPVVYAELNRTVTIAGIRFQPINDFRNNKKIRFTLERQLYNNSNSLNNLCRRK